MSKKLTMNALNKIDKKYNEVKEITVNTDDGDFKILIDKKFRRTKIQKMIIDYLEILQELKNVEGINISDVMENSTKLVIALTLKYFTNIPFPKNATNSQQLAILDKLIDSGMLEQIINEFDENEMKLLDNEIKKYADNSKQIGNQMGDLLFQAGLNEGVEFGEENI